MASDKLNKITLAFLPETCIMVIHWKTTKEPEARTLAHAGGNEISLAFWGWL